MSEQYIIRIDRVGAKAVFVKTASSYTTDINAAKTFDSAAAYTLFINGVKHHGGAKRDNFPYMKKRTAGRGRAIGGYPCFSPSPRILKRYAILRTTHYVAECYANGESERTLYSDTHNGEGAPLLMRDKYEAIRRASELNDSASAGVPQHGQEAPDEYEAILYDENSDY